MLLFFVFFQNLENRLKVANRGQIVVQTIVVSPGQMSSTPKLLPLIKKLMNGPFLGQYKPPIITLKEHFF